MAILTKIMKIIIENSKSFCLNMKIQKNLPKYDSKIKKNKILYLAWIPGYLRITETLDNLA